MADQIAQAIAKSTPADQLAPECFDQLSAMNVDMGHMLNFDYNHGVIMLTNGSACWDELRTSFTELAEWLDEQLAMAENTDVGEINDVKDLAVDVAEVAETVEAVTADVMGQEKTGVDFLVEEIENYTNYEALLSLWSWDYDSVHENEAVGLCIRPANSEEAFASCWLYRTNMYRQYGEAESFLVDSRAFAPGARLEEMPALQPYPIPGMKGGWMCNEPMNMLGRMRAACMRFAPKLYSVEDPTYAPADDISVMTYLSSRYNEGSETMMGVDEDQMSGFS